MYQVKRIHSSGMVQTQRTGFEACEFSHSFLSQKCHMSCRKRWEIHERLWRKSTCASGLLFAASLNSDLLCYSCICQSFWHTIGLNLGGVQLRVDFRTIGSCYVIVAASMQDRIFTTTWSSMGFGKPYFNNPLAIQMHSHPLLQHLCVAKCRGSGGLEGKKFSKRK